MKRLSLFGMAGAILVIVAATGQAASVGLISAVGFEGDANNAVAGAANGTAMGTTSYVAGQIGQAINLDVTANNAYINFGTGTDAVPLTGDPYGGLRGLWTGTQTMWVNTTQNIYDTDGKNLATARVAGVNTGIYTNSVQGMVFYSTMGTSNFQVQATGATQITAGSGWHLVTATYNLTTGASGTGAATIYIDGVAQAMTINMNAISSANVPVAGGRSVLGADLASSALPVTQRIQWGYKGSMDDYATFNTQLSADQAAALYNLGLTGVQSTKYGVKDSAALFDGFLNATGASTSDGKTWNYVASGLSGAAGSVGSNYVVLNGGGGGMQIASLTRLIVNGGTVNKTWGDAQVCPPGPGADIQAGMLVLDYTAQSDPAATVKSLLTTAYGSAFATGQFISTTATATHGLGWVDNTATSKISIARTVYGDVDLNGTVGLSDLGKVLTNWGVGNKWGDGDVDYNSAVGLSDLGKVLTNWGLSVGSLTPAANAVPEPSSLALLAALAGLAGVWAIRRK